MSHGLAHALDLVLAALVQRELQPARAVSLNEDSDASRRRDAVLELDSVAQPGEGVERRRAHDVRLVDLRHAVARVGQAVREVAVVGEQERAGRVDVEPPDGDDARLVRHELDDRRPPLRIACSRYDAGGLVQQHVGERLALDTLAVDLHHVVPADDGVQLADVAVDPHAARHG